MLKAGCRRVHAVRVVIYQRFKDREAATKKSRTVLPFRGFLCTHLADSPKAFVSRADPRGGVRKNAPQFRQPTGVRRSQRFYFGLRYGQLRRASAHAKLRRDKESAATE